MKKTILWGILLLLSVVWIQHPVQAQESEYSMQEYSLESKSGGEQKKIQAAIDKDNHLLLPVKEIVELAGYSFEECTRCGKDEIFDKADEDAGGKGHYFVNWYQNLLSYSVSDEVVELSVANDKVEGVTYSPLDLFEAMGIKISIDSGKKKISLSSNHVQAVYFYSSTCDSCEKLEQFFSEMEKKYSNLSIHKYNIYEVINYDLLIEYGKVYGLPDEKVGFTPSVYISDQVLIGAEIQTGFEECVKNYSQKEPTTILDTPKQENSDAAVRQTDKKSVWMQGLTAFGLGFVNGLNPCSLSMFLFLLSLLLVNRDKLLRCGISFLGGKTIMFFLLGTILYQVITRINTAVFSRWMDLFMILFAICFALLNLWDFFTARSEQYEKMKLQLPKGFKRLNHSMMKWADRFSAQKTGMLIMALIGAAVATGEFLCTGQIYLSSVVIMVQKGVNGILPVVLLVIYSIAFVVPLFVLMLIVYFGKKIFGVSEIVLEKIPVIKLISAVLFVAMAIYLVLT